MNAISVPKTAHVGVEAPDETPWGRFRQYVGSLNPYALAFVALCGLAITIETGVTLLLVNCIG
jgi:hypothetical protein